MKPLPIRVLFCAITLFLFSASLSAQQFNWIKGGGTNADMSFLPSQDWESTKYMCSDQHGNVYAASLVGNADVYADAFSGVTYGQYQNILITSYNCSGQMRWAKVITSTSASCNAFGIAADSLGHIYLAGQLPAATLHIGTDTTLPGAVYERIGLIQFDTNGHYNWIRFVGNNTYQTYLTTNTEGACLAIDNMNNAHFIPYIGSGALLMPGVTSQYGSYDLTYNTSGTLLSAVRLQLDSTLFITHASIDKQSNKLYVDGCRSGAFWIANGGDSSFHAYLAEFDVARNLVWMDTLGDPYPLGDGTQGFGDIAPDGAGHLYINSGGFGNLLYNGTLITPSTGSLGPYLALIMKTDTAGNVEWTKQFNGHNNLGLGSIVVMPGNKIASAGYFGGTATIGTDTIFSPVGYAACFTVLDSSGTLITLQSIRGDQTNNSAYAITTDTVGNLYIGGQVTDSIPDTLITAYHTVGGNSDFFVLKYGVDCSCTSMPVAAFAYNGVSTIGYTYTGTTVGLDSVVWSFGDGSTATGPTASHSYTTVGTYTVCVTAYTGCGYDIKCSIVNISCVAAPAPSFTDTGSHTLGFVYTAPTTALDSIVWSFGDGSTANGATVSHTYAVADTYLVCVTAYNQCGSDSVCHTVITHTTGIGSLTIADVKVYPNPAMNQLMVKGITGNTNYRLLSVTGVPIQTGTFHSGMNAVPMSSYAPGIYILELTGKGGERKMVRVVKE